MKITSQVNDTEGSSGHKEWKKLETIPTWQLDRMKSRKEVTLEAQREIKKVHLELFADICHLKNEELEPKLQK